MQNYFEENEEKKTYWKIRESKPKKSNIWILSCTTDGDLTTLCIFKSPHNITREREEGAITNDVFQFKKLSTLKADVRAVWKPVSWFALPISWLFFSNWGCILSGFFEQTIQYDLLLACHFLLDFLRLLFIKYFFSTQDYAFPIRNDLVNFGFCDLGEMFTDVTS